MHTKHGMKEKLMYVNMLKEEYTVDYIKKHFGIHDTQLKVMWTKYQSIVAYSTIVSLQFELPKVLHNSTVRM